MVIAQIVDEGQQSPGCHMHRDMDVLVMTVVPGGKVGIRDEAAQLTEVVLCRIQLNRGIHSTRQFLDRMSGIDPGPATVRDISHPDVNTRTIGRYAVEWWSLSGQTTRIDAIFKPFQAQRSVEA